MFSLSPKARELGWGAVLPFCCFDRASANLLDPCQLLELGIFSLNLEKVHKLFKRIFR